MVSTESLHSIDVLQGLSDAQFGSVAALGEHESISPGTILVKSTEPTKAICLVLRGQVEIFAHSMLNDVSIRTAGSGESFPLAALVGSEPLFTSARALTSLELLVVPVGRFRSLCDEQPEIGRQVYQNAARILAAQYRTTLDHLVRAGQQALQGVDVWPNRRDMPAGTTARPFDRGTPEWWECIADSPAEQQRAELRALFESLVPLDKAERLGAIEELVGGEFALPGDKQSRITRARLLAWLEMDLAAAKVVAEGYDEVIIRAMPARVAIRQLEEARLLQTTLSQEQRDRLHGIVPELVSR